MSCETLTPRSTWSDNFVVIEIYSCEHKLTRMDNTIESWVVMSYLPIPARSWMSHNTVGADGLETANGWHQVEGCAKPNLFVRADRTRSLTVNYLLTEGPHARYVADGDSMPELPAEYLIQLARDREHVDLQFVSREEAGVV